MIQRNIVVVGASAGGVAALTVFVKSLPENFGASIFVVLHVSSHSPSNLPAILSRAGLLKARHPFDGEIIEQGVIYVAPPDHHILLEKNYILVKKGPKENRFRPSVDALFRSAAYVHGNRVIGIILSGLLNDGTSGLWSIKRMGGLSIVQEPADADYPSMPMNALEYVKSDHTVPVTDIGHLLVDLITKKVKKKVKLGKREKALMSMEVIIARQDGAFEMGIMEMGELSPFSCPECHGVLVRLFEDKIVRFRCHTGHAYTASALLAEMTTSVEEKMWQAMRGLEETTMLLDHIGKHFKEQGFPGVAGTFIKKSKISAKRAQIIHDSVFAHELLSEDIRHKNKKKVFNASKPKH